MIIARLAPTSVYLSIHPPLDTGLVMKRPISRNEAFTHSGGVNVSFGDGHTKFVADTVDLHVWRAVAAIEDGGTFSLE